MDIQQQGRHYWYFYSVTPCRYVSKVQVGKNPYTDSYSKRRQDIGFPLPGVSFRQGIFPIHSRGFCL